MHEHFAEKVLDCHCDECFPRRGNLKVIDFLKPKWLRFARKYGNKTFSVPC